VPADDPASFPCPSWPRDRLVVHDASMREPGEPTWRLVLLAAQQLDAATGEFRMQDLVAEVQRMDPGRGRGSIQPVIQGMTANAGSGPASPCGKPLIRVGHGVYKIGASTHQEATGSRTAGRAAALSRPAGRTAERAAEIDIRLAGVTRDFAACVEVYDRQVPFQRAGQYEWHRLTIEARLRCGGAGQALEDAAFVRLLYGTLQRWGIGRRASLLVPLAEFRQRMLDQAAPISALEETRIDDETLDVPAVCGRIWQVIENLGIVRNRSLIVPGTKALHHVLPDLVPPMDRAWTGAFFLWSAAAPQNAQPATFTRTFAGLAQVARAVKPDRYIGKDWRTSRSKILDNAIIGYCQLNKISPAGT
jgi:hypothetical protein